jgi:hypothetical protein
MNIPTGSQGRPSEAGRSYSAGYQTTLTVWAFVIALLPIPVAGLGLLPMYQMHARFLVFYGPVVCLLILAYLHYVRGSLARLMFADLLRPQIQADPYYRPSFEQSLGRLGGWLRGAILALLPILCLFLSFYCFTRYATRLNDSIDIAVLDQMQSPAPAAQRPPSAEETGLIPSGESPKPQSRRARIAEARRDSAPAAPATAKADSLAGADPRALRQYVLRTAGIDDIPLFGELTVLYIGAFAAALVAIILMALKEYAKTAMGLSERDLVLGPAPAESEQG